MLHFSEDLTTLKRLNELRWDFDSRGGAIAMELSWSLSWTLITVGLCWLFVSCAVALALGRIIQRSKPAVDEADANRFDDVAAEDDGELEEAGSRAASGTRLKPVWLAEQEKATQERKVS
jgi:hypothetical protein